MIVTALQPKLSYQITLLCFSASPELGSQDMNRGVAVQMPVFFSILLFINIP
jgi:hypothetical protein